MYSDKTKIHFCSDCSDGCEQEYVSLKIQVMVYPGHDEGKRESKAISEYLSTLDQNLFKILRIDLPYQKNSPPYILFIRKMK